MGTEQKEESMGAARRRFLAECGRFSLATPPAIALLLAASNRKYAVATSGGGGNNDNNNQQGER